MDKSPSDVSLFLAEVHDAGSFVRSFVRWLFWLGIWLPVLLIRECLNWRGVNRLGQVLECHRDA